ncbi:hypothetical protein [Haloferula sp. BvORR071]|uniref:hypothetical protein n=1 Tax=Haloferula sp. BvORR071 TaxID=1396141 RepID=UPI00055539B0|nr:hypothetical protein [Haloferula sp. BvORR071]
MKVLLLLPFVLAASSCIYPEPYTQQRPPYRQGRPGYPYGQNRPGPQEAPGPDAYGGETGRYERMDGGGNAPGPQADSRPTAPRIDDDFQPEGNASAPQPAPAPAPAPKKEYPFGKTSSKPGYVVSPYAPYNELDLNGIKSGALAKDPSNGKIFRVP